MRAENILWWTHGKKPATPGNSLTATSPRWPQLQRPKFRLGPQARIENPFMGAILLDFLWQLSSIRCMLLCYYRNCTVAGRPQPPLRSVADNKRMNRPHVPGLDKVV